MDYWNWWILWLKLLLFLLKSGMFCSVFEGEGWEVMVLFTDCPVVKLIDGKKNRQKKNTFGIKKYPNCLAITLVFAFVSGRSTFFFYISFHRKSTCSCLTLWQFQHFYLKYRFGVDVTEKCMKTFLWFAWVFISVCKVSVCFSSQNAAEKGPVVWMGRFGVWDGNTLVLTPVGLVCLIFLLRNYKNYKLMWCWCWERGVLKFMFLTDFR